MSLSIYTHPDCEIHEMPRHPERPDRLRAVMTQLSNLGLLDTAQVTLATEISDELLQQVHPREYIAQINGSEPATGVIKVDPDTYMSSGSTRAAKLAAGALVEATIDVLDGRFDRAFCAIRPPGHHAEVAAAMGFCLYNNVALAAETALSREDIHRVAIIDFDVHHCNGTVDIFKDRPEVMVCSSFQEHFYPHRYLDYSNDHILNLPLAAGSSGDAFRRGVETSWLQQLERHQPDMVFISAGFDAHVDDPLGELRFQIPDYEWITHSIVDIAERCAGGRLVSTLEGGYDLASLARSAGAHVSILAA
ncbi:MAG: acetoin utilization deacetylase AcuC-like enzyme [Candidatus Azotimanducaceae bacterium]|jgi:acetoin utilization deacetylase AcuC-like enzyme